MASTNKSSLGLNMWEDSDKPVRQDFVKDNVIIDEKIVKLNNDIGVVNTHISNLHGQVTNINSNLGTVNTQISNTNSAIDRINNNLGGGKIFTSVSQLTTIENPTINQVCYSMPANSMLYAACNSQNGFPKTWGFLTVHSDNNRNCKVDFTTEEVGLGKLYKYAYYAKRQADGGVKGTGWKTIYDGV